jgi:hypothetical protein
MGQGSQRNLAGDDQVPTHQFAEKKVEPNSGSDPKQESVQLEAQSTVA